MKGNHREDVAIDRELVRRGGLFAFFCLAWEVVEPSMPLDVNWHHKLICDHLVAVSRGFIRDLGINIPPGCTKSSLVSVFFPAWEAIETGGGSAWIMASFDDSLSLRDSNKCKALIESEWYQARWGERVRVSKNSTHANSATEWNMLGTTGGGWRFSTSVAGKATGRHGDFLVIDDPHKPKDTTDVGLAMVTTWAQETVASRRKDPKTFRRILIMQRLHEDDLSAFYQKSGGWVWLILPMEYDPDQLCVTDWGRDPRTQEGELLWPSRYPAEEVAKLKGPNGVGPRGFAAQYQQRPNPKTGGIFKRDWFNSTYRRLPNNGLYLLQSWDMRFKEASDSGDWVAGGVLGREGGNYYLVDYIRERLSFTESVSAVEDLTGKHPSAFLKLIENKANGPAVVNTLKKKVSGLVLVEPDGGKVARANAVSAIYESGNFLLPNESDWPHSTAAMTQAQCREYFIREHIKFPKGHDDLVDMCTQGLHRLHMQTNSGYIEGLKRMANQLGVARQ